MTRNHNLRRAAFFFGCLLFSLFMLLLTSCCPPSQPQIAVVTRGHVDIHDHITVQATILKTHQRVQLYYDRVWQIHIGDTISVVQQCGTWREQ